MDSGDVAQDASFGKVSAFWVPGESLPSNIFVTATLIERLLGGPFIFSHPLPRLRLLVADATMG